MNDKRGSKWRQWDLHVHTPASLVHHFKPNGEEDVWETYIKDLEALPSTVQVLGINDYLFLDGYRKVLYYKANGRLPNIQLILPVLEFRIRKFAGHDQFKRINLHIIFSDEIGPEIIQNQFLNGLTGKYKLAAGAGPANMWSGVVTVDSLVDLGQKIKATVPADKLPDYGSDLVVGFNNLNCDEDDIISQLNTSTYFTDKFLVAIGKTEWDALSWGDGSIAEKKDIINKSDIVFTSAVNLEAYDKAKKKLTDQGVNDLLLDCSDAHYNSSSTEKDRIGKCLTWIKADPSFEGLKQILNERDRLFVGDMPRLLTRMYGNPTKFIDKLTINKIPNSNLDEPWFDGLEITFNAGLVAIIGNKGNGKSALADIVSLCGNTHNEQNFSFLTTNKFRQKKVNKAQEFNASIIWRNGVADAKNLNAHTDLGMTEKVKYIPQNFLETLCSSEEGDAFEKELRKIIFSHTSQSDRIGATSLEELIENKSEIIEKDISKRKNEITTINRKIVELEARKHPDQRKIIVDALQQKKAELEAHEKNKPIEVSQPVNNTPDATANDNLTKLRTKIETIEAEIIKKQAEKLRLNIAINELTKSSQAITSVVTDFDKVIGAQKPILFKHGIEIADVLSYKSDASVITEKIKGKQAELDVVNAALDVSKDTSLPLQKEKALTEIKMVQDQLDAPTKKYQKYLDDLKAWQATEIELKGNKETEGSLLCLEESLRYIDNDLLQEYEAIRNQRLQLLVALYDKKNEMIELYRYSFKPITEFIDSYGDLMKNYNIKVDVTFQLQGFYEKFFDHISSGAKGSFIGKEEGYKKLQQLAEIADLNTRKGFLDFLLIVVTHILQDKREDQNNTPRRLRDQLKKGYEPVDFYDFLFSFDYLTPVYKLKLEDKDLSELSPGERGALLLIFYLLLDSDDIPLVIDQPEENLDNQSVYTILVQFIKQVKDRRQIFIITHNPNLAVVCDAEQIIYVHIDKTNQNKVSYQTGAIENPYINKKVVEILEGTFPAFDNRTEKYKVTKR